MKNKVLIPRLKYLSRSFTLIELIIVIIIVGILAAVGISQYSKMVEKGRSAEARMNIGFMRKKVMEYWLENGSIAAMSQADAGIGTGMLPIWGTCNSNYYYYYLYAYHPDYGTGGFTLSAVRCTSGGKSPQGSSDFSYGWIEDCATGWQSGWKQSDTWASRNW